MRLTHPPNRSWPDLLQSTLSKAQARSPYRFPFILRYFLFKNQMAQIKSHLNDFKAG
jgi:uncharacterized protein VirK/YbjX